MKTRLILSALLLSSLGATSSAQSVCDQLQIVDIRYDAFHDSLLLVHVINGSPDIFSYPGFILYDAQGDTIAKETPNFFGIGQEQVHALPIYPNFDALTEVIDGKLELWTLFFDTLVCTYDISEPVCPEGDCNELVFSFGNLGGALTFGFFHYSVLDSAGAVLVEVDFNLEEQVQAFADTICLPSGDYTLQLSADEGSVGGQPFTSSTSWLPSSGAPRSPAISTMPIRRSRSPSPSTTIAPKRSAWWNTRHRKGKCKSSPRPMAFGPSHEKNRSWK